MKLKDLATWLNSQILEHPEWGDLSVVEVDLWLPKTLAIEAHPEEGHVSITMTEGYQEL